MSQLSFNFPDGEAAPTVMVFDGEDGYAGLTALVLWRIDPAAVRTEQCWGRVHRDRAVSPRLKPSA